MSFHEEFLKFQEEFSKVRSLIVAINSINSKAANDLNKEYIILNNSNALLSRIHYIAHSSADFSIEQLLFPLKGIEHMSVSNTIKLFENPNHKNKITYLIQHLKDHPEIFSQMIYFSLLTPFNHSLIGGQFDVFSEDDSIYFCFTTFPALYNFFMTKDDKNSAISLITNLFSLHLALHGPNFGKPHRFLSHFVSSFFLSTNPGFFFDSSVQPLIREFWPKLKAVQYKYQKVGDSLVRTEYWHQCIIFAAQLLRRMCENAPLMPTAARFLITEMSQIQTNGFPFVELFIFDSMFCDYLENKLFSDDPTLMHDICNVIRCCYPQDVISSPIYSMISLMNSQFLDTISINKLINAIKLDKFENDPLSLAISYCEEFSLFTPRDLTLFHRAITLFLNYVDDNSGLTEIVNNFQGVSKPTASNDNQYLMLKSWNDKSQSNKVKLVQTRQFDEIIDCLSTINSTKMPFTNASELSKMSLTYCSNFLTTMQKQRIDSINRDYDKNQNLNFLEALSTVKSNLENLRNFSSDISTSLFSIQSEKERNNNQFLNYLYLFMRWKLLPTMYELYPYDFNFNSKNIFAAKDEQTISRVYRAIEIHIDPLHLPKENDHLIRKTLVMMYIDQLDKMYDYQEHSTNSNLTILLKKYANSVLVGEEIPKSQKIISRKCIDLFKALNESSPPSHNLKITINAMRIVKNLEDKDLMLILSQSQNQAIFGLINFLRTYVSNTKMEKTIFSDEEATLVKRFIDVGLVLRTTKV
ncbi:hypothetical protein TRFO_33504 [Tritrichomonas foetus]|uniref:Uncharacterized protein n=1 Tax=Tritrichomonas foetus TaxID=1144522 RepID=A0A1J4JR40_9EUKA|nr:hypothetical protein TRFO_33504 [Tritrichomonas foetus]|eukprot:OHS99979.1 hypothetical protein TRFO_33504 [Tritrichomonas foetus]